MKRWSDTRSFAVGSTKVLFFLSLICASLGLESPPGPTNRCSSDSCEAARSKKAAEILKHRDEAVNPCDNIFQYACGNWQEPSLEERETTETLLLDDLIKGIPDSDQSKAHGLVRDFHKVCMDDGARGEKPLELLKTRVLANWPPTAGENWNRNFDWMDWQGKAKQAGFTDVPFVDWVPVEGLKNDIQSYDHQLQLPTSLSPAFKNETSQPYEVLCRERMGKVARLLGASDDQVARNVPAACRFESDLTGITMKRSFGDDCTSVDQLQKEFPGLDWAVFVEKTLKPFLDPNTEPTIAVRNSTTWKEFIALINTTPKRILATYAIWKEIEFSLPFLTPEFVAAHEQFLKAINFPDMSRKEFCDAMTKQYAEFGIVELYLDQANASKATVEQIFKAVREKMLGMINGSSWLNEREKRLSSEMLMLMDYTIGRSEALLDKTELDAFYAEAEVTKDNFLKTLLDLNVFKNRKDNSLNWRLRILPLSRSPYSDYGMPQNYLSQIYIPLSLIPSPSFNNELPMYLNFGALGSHLAREMFESVGQIGEDSFDDKVKCFKQLKFPSSFLIRIAMRQPIVDDVVGHFIGLKAAYAAYKQSTADSGPELALPGASYTSNQLFWMSYLQSLCFLRANDTPFTSPLDNLKMIDLSMIMLLQHVPEISRDFECPVGSYLNPEEKCTWW